MTQYLKFVTKFFDLAHGQASRPNVVHLDQLDQLRALCIEYLRGEGEPEVWAAYALAAAHHFIRGSRPHPPSAWKAAWDKLELPERAPSLTQALTLAVASAMSDAGHPRSAIAVAVAFECAPRAGEV
eukprot:7823736-Pyramimonas_sp.AAC.1